jgi:transposase
MKTKEIAKRFGVGPAWCRGIKQRLREHGLRGVIRQKHGPDPIFDEARRDQLATLVSQAPDATLQELKAMLDVKVSISTIWRTLQDMKLTLKKKSLHAAERDRPDVVARRHDWEQSLPGVDVEMLVFLDESAVNTARVRDRGRCPQGERLVDSVPAGLWQTSTLVAAICLDGVVAPMVIDGPLNGESFAQYVETSLVPALEPGNIVVMDNLPVHKSQRVSDAIAAAGCTLVFLPPYSPDYSPIENMWSKVKTHLRAAAARTFNAVVDAAGDALRSITPEDCDGYFRHCGYDALPN